MNRPKVYTVPSPLSKVLPPRGWLEIPARSLARLKSGGSAFGSGPQANRWPRQLRHNQMSGKQKLRST